MKEYLNRLKFQQQEEERFQKLKQLQEERNDRKVETYMSRARSGLDHSALTK